ncbi:MAG: hypothetical protein ACLPUG_15530 [Acidimicrobiales bacterium]
MIRIAKRLTVVCAASLGMLFVLPGSAHLALGESSLASSSRHLATNPLRAAATTIKYQAEILPGSSFSVGTSLVGGNDGSNYGFGLTANDVDNDWTCTSICTLDFVFFVFANQDETTSVKFEIVAPSGKTAYQYTWTSKLAVGGNWYSVVAKGDYSKPGTYFAEVFVAGSLAGWIPEVIGS